ncbi:hypothetical protein AM593_03614, partial [Mytilus galloprovincialis]
LKMTISTEISIDKAGLEIRALHDGNAFLILIISNRVPNGEVEIIPSHGVVSLFSIYEFYCPSDSPCLPCRREFALLKDSLLKIPNQTGRATNLNRTEEIMFVEKEIWSNLTSDELAQIKAFLNTTKKEKFGKRVLEEIKNGVDLFRKLHELCLVDEENFDYLITILKFVSRNDLIQKIMALDTPGSRFETEL